MEYPIELDYYYDNEYRHTVMFESAGVGTVTEVCPTSAWSVGYFASDWGHVEGNEKHFRDPKLRRGADLHAPGAKDDSAKIDPTLILDSMPRALMAVAEVGTFGANKYSRDGWLSVPNGEQRYAAAQDRHRFLRCSGEYVDSDSQLPHLYHEAWNALAKLELHLRNKETDNV